MDTNTLFHDGLRYGCAWETPSAQCLFDRRSRDTHSAQQADIRARTPGNRRAAVTRLTGTRPPNRFSTFVSRTRRHVLRMRLGRYVRNWQRYPLQA